MLVVQDMITNARNRHTPETKWENSKKRQNNTLYIEYLVLKLDKTAYMSDRRPY